MMCGQILPWALLLLVTSRPLWAHPITDSAEMPYSGPVSAEDRGGVGSLDELESFPQQDAAAAGLRYASLLSSELNRDGIRGIGLLPRGMKREVLLEKPSLLNRWLGVRKQFRKRGGTTECFWKYCV